jgi:hypothetical protein
LKKHGWSDKKEDSGRDNGHAGRSATLTENTCERFNSKLQENQDVVVEYM